MPFVYSTASTNVEYAQFGPPIEGRPAPKLRAVVIKGGTNVASKHLVTPIGVMTEVSAEDAVFLSQDANFKRHAAAGFVTLHDRRVDPEVVAANMKLRDGSAPLVPGDFEAGKTPKTDVRAAA